MFKVRNPAYPSAMRLFLLNCLTMTAFAANSLLTRLAVESGATDPTSFASIRVASGTVMLVLLARLRRRPLPLRSYRRVAGAGALALYMVGFSLAYLSLNAGVGALILFGAVQITMFGLASASGVPVTARQILGAILALCGLAWILWPAGTWSVDPVGAALMVMAGFGWAIYTRSGVGEPDALSASAANFCYALPLTLLAPAIGGVPISAAPKGMFLAILSGAIASGLGYALWFWIVPQLRAVVAATVQLSVPVIAVLGGALLLGEAVHPHLVLGAAVVLGGIGLSVSKGRSA